MQCRSCGTEIADKAIVCYRCGAGTTDPVRRPAPIARHRSSLVPAFIAMLALIAGALYLGQVSETTANPEQWRMAAGGLLAAAIFVLVVRLIQRRRR
jgi:hypothetical protein